MWSAGCASGEEAYSLAVLLAEAFGEDRFRQSVKIYATDADEDALAEARRGRYRFQDLVDAFGEDRTRRFFDADGEYGIFRGDLRRALIFGRHDLVQDPPISRIDLLASATATWPGCAPSCPWPGARGESREQERRGCRRADRARSSALGVESRAADSRLGYGSRSDPGRLPLLRPEAPDDRSADSPAAGSPAPGGRRRGRLRRRSRGAPGLRVRAAGGFRGGGPGRAAHHAHRPHRAPAHPVPGRRRCRPGIPRMASRWPGGSSWSRRPAGTWPSPRAGPAC